MVYLRFLYDFECLAVEFEFDYFETMCKVNYILSGDEMRRATFTLKSLTVIVN